MTIRLLCADDSNIIQKSVRIAFDHYQVETMEANSYPALLELTSKREFDIIFIDSCLTGIHQAKDLESLQEKTKETHFIILKGSYDPTTTESWEQSGFTNIIEKPFSMDDIHTCVTNCGLLLTPKSDSNSLKKQLPFEYYDYTTAPSQKAKKRSPESQALEVPTEAISEITTKVLNQIEYKKIAEKIEPNLKETVEKKTEELVKKYCQDNFIPIAKKILQEEIKNLVAKK